MAGRLSIWDYSCTPDKWGTPQLVDHRTLQLVAAEATDAESKRSAQEALAQAQAQCTTFAAEAENAKTKIATFQAKV